MESTDLFSHFTTAQFKSYANSITNLLPVTKTVTTYIQKILLGVIFMKKEY